MKTFQEVTASIHKINIIRYLLSDDGKFPNNVLLPLLIYKDAFQIYDGKIIEEIFESNRWVNAWQDGIFNFDHYHSTAHEVLAVAEGTARIQFGGPNGIGLMVKPGDVIIIPAGVVHKNMDSDTGFKVVGAYPEGQEYDMKYGREDERPEADENIKAVPLPETDPVYGMDGPLLKHWIK